MDPTIEINEQVDVIPTFRRHQLPDKRCFPRRMYYRDEIIEFTKLGLRHPTTKGKRMLHIFDVSDGCDDYRLEFDAEALTWTLISKIPGGTSA